MTNSPHLAQKLPIKCGGGRDHVPLMNGRAGPAPVYAPDLARAMSQGFEEQSKSYRSGTGLIEEMHTGVDKKRLVNY